MNAFKVDTQMKALQKQQIMNQVYQTYSVSLRERTRVLSKCIQHLWRVYVAVYILICCVHS